MANGIIVMDKPAGWTSHDVVGKLRRLLGERRIGHAGTLDPMATGVLPVFVGRATRAVEFASEGRKEYIAGLRLGVVTDTQDITGQILEEHPVHLSRQQVEEALAPFRGEILQIPPMYSALKVDGKKLYELARKGKEVARKPRPITIYELELGEETAPGEYILRVQCSKGTYVRTLCHDIGQALGCGGTMCSLRRTMAAGFDLSRAISMEEAAALAEVDKLEEALLPVDAYFSGYPTLTVHAREEKKLRNGAAFSADAADGDYRVYSSAGEFLALCRGSTGTFTTIKSFFSVD